MSGLWPLLHISGNSHVPREKVYMYYDSYIKYMYVLWNLWQNTRKTFNNNLSLWILNFIYTTYNIVVFLTVLYDKIWQRKEFELKFAKSAFPTIVFLPFRKNEIAHSFFTVIFNLLYASEFVIWTSLALSI